MTDNLMDGLLKEMNRTREVLKMYEEIPQGAFGAMMIKKSIAEAESAISHGDVIEMMRSYQSLKEIE